MSQTPTDAQARPGHPLNALTAVALAAFATVMCTGTAHAFEFDTGNPDLTVRWDNTPRVNLGWPFEKRDDKIGN